MQDAIERKIEKFSSQNQAHRRVGTSYINSGVGTIVMGNIPRLNSNQGPGTSGSKQGRNSSLGVNGKNTLIDDKRIFQSQGHSSDVLAADDNTLRSQSLKRPNTNANKHFQTTAQGVHSSSIRSNRPSVDNQGTIKVRDLT
jgi:hypothetical protein